MERTLPRPLDWRWLTLPLLAVMAVWNAQLVLGQLQHIALTTDGRDFTVTFADVIHRDNPFDNPAWLWSPLAVPLLKPIVPFGLEVWQALHLLPLLLIRPWKVAALVALSWPFWWDIGTANVGIFVFVAAWTALRGNRVGTVVYLAMCLLMPRPLMAPVALWLLWHQPWARVPFVVAGVAQVGIVAGMGLLDDWALRLLGATDRELAKEGLRQANIGPSRILGAWWTPIGLGLAAWFTVKGRLGIASLAASPYVFPFYLLMGFLELADQSVRDRHRTVKVSGG